MTDETAPKLIQYKVSTRYKKSVAEVEYYTKDGKTVAYTTGWRWGYVTLLVPEGTDLAAELDAENNEVLEIDDLEYEVYDREMDVGCWDEWDYGELDDDEIAAIDEAFEEEGDAYSALVDILGWEQNDSELSFSGPLDIENMGEYVPYVYTETNEEGEDDNV